MYILIQELQINHVLSGWSWEASQVHPFAVLSHVSHLFEEKYHIVTNSFGKVRCVPETILCKVYMVKVWEGIVRNSFSCHTIPKAWHAHWFLCSFSCCTVPSILYA